MRGISSPSEEVLAAHKSPWCMELVKVHAAGFIIWKYRLQTNFPSLLRAKSVTLLWPYWAQIISDCDLNMDVKVVIAWKRRVSLMWMASRNYSIVKNEQETDVSRLRSGLEDGVKFSDDGTNTFFW